METGQMFLSEMPVDFKNTTSAFAWRKTKHSSQIGDNRYCRLATSYYLYIYWTSMLLEEPTLAAAGLYRILIRCVPGAPRAKRQAVPHCADIK